MPQLFKKQFRDFNNESNKISRNLVRKYLNINSSKRVKIDKIDSEKINTISEFLKVNNDKVYVIIINPLQLDLKKKKIPETVKIIFNWVSIIDRDNQKIKPLDILGISSDKILFSKPIGKPVFEIFLENYSDDSDRGYYLVKDLKLKQNGIFSINNKDGFMEIRRLIKIEKGYPLSNHYKINFQYSFKNIVSIRLLSTMFPIPNKFISNNITYTVYLSIKGLFNLQNLELQCVSCINYKDVLEDLILKIREKTGKHNIYPLLTKKEYYLIFLLKLRILEDKIIKVVNHHHFFYFFISSLENFSINQIIWVVHNNYNGIYRIVPSFYYRIKISNETIHNNLKEGSKIYKDNKFIAIIYSIDKLEDYTFLDIIMYNDDNLFIGDILTSDNIFSCEILEKTLLGGNSIPVAIKISSLPSNINLPIKKGIFTFVKFNINYPKSNILAPLQFNHLGKYSFNINSIPKMYTVKSKLSYEGNNTLSLTFNSDILPNHNIYQIVGGISSFKKPAKKLREYKVSLISKDSINNNLFLDRDISELVKDRYVSCFSNRGLPFYRKISDIDYEKKRITIENKEDKYVDKIVLPESDLQILPKNSGKLIKSTLQNDIMRGERRVEIDVSDKFIPGFIIQLSEGNIENTQTNSELNIIEEIIESDEKITLLLKFPIINNWEYGTPIIQKYPYLEIKEVISDIEIIIETDLDIMSIVGASGVLNLFSETLIEDNEEKIELPEYFVKIEDIIQENDSEYKLILTNPIDYPKNLLDYYDYLVLFLDNELNDISFSTYNIRDEIGWKTRILINQPQLLSDNLMDSKIIISGMLGDTIPIFGLTYDDTLSRELLGQDLDLGEDYYSQIITTPHNSKVLTVTSVGNNYLEIEGRYLGRGGIIELIDNTNMNFDLDLYFSDLKASQISHNQFKSNFNINVIDQEIVNNIISKKGELMIKIIPLDIPPPSDSNNSIDDKYFLIYSPDLDNLIEIPDYLNCENKLDNIRNPFNRILLNYRDLSEEYIYDSFLPIEKTFYQNPIKELYELEFSFLWTDGQEVNFGNKEHNFVLEITEEEGTLEKINPRTGNTNK